MAAATSAQPRTMYRNGRPPTRLATIKANTIIHRGTLAMHVAGVAEPARAGVANSVLLGVAQDTYDNSAGGSNADIPGQMLFERCPFEFRSQVGADQLTTASTGTLVAVANDNELKKTIATDDLQVRAIERLTELDWIVEIP